MSNITEADLLAAVFAELDASLPPVMGPGEFSITMYRAAHPGMTQAVAEGAINKLVKDGLIERLPDKRRMPDGKVVYAYRRVSASGNV